MITQNISKPLGTNPPCIVRSYRQIVDLVNGKIVHFYGFADSDDNRPRGRIISPPMYMLIKVPTSTANVGQLLAGVIPLRRSTITFNIMRTGIGAKYKQFPVTLAYAITDYKCQGETFSDGLLADLQTPPTGSTEAASLYVQLSRVQSLAQLSIMRDFDLTELQKPLSADLEKELEWEEQMDARTKENYKYLE